MRGFEHPAAASPNQEQQERLEKLVDDVDRRLASPTPPKTLAYAIWAALDAKNIKSSEARTLWFARVMGARAERQAKPQGIVEEHPGMLRDAAEHERMYGPGEEDERRDEAA